MDRNNITDITFWIRVERSFRIRDFFWFFSDKILYVKESKNPFRNNFFVTQLQNNTEVRMESEPNEEGNYSYLRMDVDWIIFKYVLSKGDSFEKWITFLEKAMKYLIEIISDLKISKLTRFWIIYNHQIVGNIKEIDDICKKMTNGKVIEVNEFSCRFSKRLPEGISLLGKDEKDFNNLIYNFWSSKEKSEIWLDYQYYFIPSKTLIDFNDGKKFLESWNDILDRYFYKALFNWNEKK